MRVELEKEPGKRPGLIIAMVLVGLVSFIAGGYFFWYTYVPGYFGADEWLLISLLLLCHSILQVVTLIIYQNIHGVVYRDDKIRRGTKAYIAVMIVLMPTIEVLGNVSCDGDIPSIIALFIMLGIIYGLYAIFIVLAWDACDCWVSFDEKPGSSTYSYSPVHDSVFDELESDSDYTYSGRSLTDDYYGMHGEFDTNDRMRAHMEDMEQMSHDDGFDPHDHGYDWDEISDARNDGYLD